METLLEFFQFKYPNIMYVLLGSVLLSISSSIVGCFTFVRRKSLTGDVISHAVLPGICVSFIISGTKDPTLLIVGAFISSWIAILFMNHISSSSKLKEDTATGLSLSVFFGVGILLLTYIQNSNNENQSGLNTFLFGRAATLVGHDLLVFSIIALIILITVYLFFKEFVIISFDPSFAKTIGIPIGKLEIILTSITVLAVITGIQAIGLILMAAMLITPVATAHCWTNKMSTLIFLSSIFGMLSGITGAYISYIKPAMPTGPWMVTTLSIIAFFSFFFSPKKGIFIKKIKRISVKRQLLEENILKHIHRILEEKNHFFQPVSIMLLKRNFQTQSLSKALKRLTNKGYIINKKENIQFTKKGFEKGKHIVRIHRLWEVYLTKHLNIASDHVHEDADTIEHVITPELENELEKLLSYPKKDPHHSIIPKK